MNQVQPIKSDNSNGVVQHAFKGVVAAGDRRTAEAAATTLRRGGNAVDAAVAATFASFVAEMALVNIGGGGIALVYTAQDRQTTSYDFFSDMPTGRFDPAQADFDRILVDFGAATQPFYIGRASVAVPGVVAGLCHMARQHGTLPLPVLLQPAIDLAEGGITLSAAQAQIAHLLRDIFTHTPRSAALYAPGGRIASTDTHLSNPALARTLARLGREGADYFYRGDLAAQIVADQQAHGGLITPADLAAYRVQTGEAISLPYRGYTILLPPPASIGGPLIAFSLQLLAAVEPGRLAHSGPAHVRLLAEVMRLTNIARARLQPTSAGMMQFLSPAHLAEYRQRLRAVLAGATQPQEPTFPPGPNDTTHLSVVDAAGNMAGITTSAGEGAGFLVGETGVALNNMLGEIDLHPAGFHRSPPGQRLQTMMSPTIILKAGRPLMTLGSGGSTRLRSAILQVISNVLDFGLPLPEAVVRPRVHFEEGVLQLEGGIAPAVATELSANGYQVNHWPERSMYFGGVHAVGVFDNRFSKVGDDRRGGVGLFVG